MRGIASIKRFIKGPEAEAPEVKDPLPKGLRQRVYDAPADYNRETRRSVGLVSRIWRWDVAAFGNAPQLPRYARRHGTRVIDHIDKHHRLPRRVRRERARLNRAMQFRGIAL